MASAHSTKRQSRVRFKELKRFPGYYVGSDGSVWSSWRRFYRKGQSGAGVQYVPGGPWVRIKNTTIRGGYQDVELRRNKVGVHCLVHRLVIEAFVGPPPSPEHQCAHGNGNPADNHAENLRWATRVENQADRVRHGTHCRGQRHGIAKLTDEQAALIRARSATESITALAKAFGVSRYVVGDVVNGRTYRVSNDA